MPKVVIATRAGGPEVLTIVEQATRPRRDGEAVVSVRAAGVNPADYKMFGGLFGSPEFPMRLGFEAAGVVVDAGPGAAGPAGPLAVGDEVIAFRVFGAYAEEIVVPASALVPKPISLGWAEAGGLMLTGATAWHALVATAVADGDVVLVHGGAGGVGVMALQLAAIRGARVIATGSERNHGLIRELGAEPVRYGDGLANRVKALAPGGVTVALDLVGTDEALAVSLELVADRDRIATIANFGTGPNSGIKVLGGGPGADPGTEIRDAARLELTRLTEAGRLRVVVSARYPLTQVAEAQRAIASGHTAGKIVLVP